MSTSSADIDQAKEHHGEAGVDNPVANQPVLADHLAAQAEEVVVDESKLEVDDDEDVHGDYDDEVGEDPIETASPQASASRAGDNKVKDNENVAVEDEENYSDDYENDEE